MSVKNVQLVTTGIVPTVAGNSTSPAQQLPTFLLMETNDTLATVLATGYLNRTAATLDFAYNNNQMALVYTTDNGPVWLKVVISGLNISLAYPASSEMSGLTYTGTLTVGHLLSVESSSGVAQDSGVVAAAVATYTGATVIGNIPKASTIAGKFQDSGIPATELMLLNATNTMAAGSSVVLAKVNGTESSNAVTASGTAGVITTSSLTTAGGSSYAITWTNTFITSSSVISLTIMGGTNTTENITYKVVPGSGTATLTIYNNTTATALNGTILIGYSVW